MIQESSCPLPLRKRGFWEDHSFLGTQKSWEIQNVPLHSEWFLSYSQLKKTLLQEGEFFFFLFSSEGHQVCFPFYCSPWPESHLLPVCEMRDFSKKHENTNQARTYLSSFALQIVSFSSEVGRASCIKNLIEQIFMSIWWERQISGNGLFCLKLIFFFFLTNGFQTCSLVCVTGKRDEKPEPREIGTQKILSRKLMSDGIWWDAKSDVGRKLWSS